MITRAAACAAACLAWVAPAQAEDSEALTSFTAMTPETALVLAQAALEHCRAEGFQIAVAVVDRGGLTQVVLRDRFAGPHTVDTATRKAWTAVSFRTPTLEMNTLIEEGELMAGLRNITNALALGGGVPIEAAGSIVGGVGVSGAPSPVNDDDCARAGVAAVEDALAF